MVHETQQEIALTYFITNKLQLYQILCYTMYIYCRISFKICTWSWLNVLKLKNMSLKTNCCYYMFVWIKKVFPVSHRFDFLIQMNFGLAGFPEIEKYMASVRKNKIRTLWASNCWKNKNIEPEQNFTGSY